MYELSLEDYNKAIPFLNNIANEIVFAHSVVEKKQKGKIFVDNIEQPEVLLIYHYSGFGFLAGSTENESFNRVLVDMLYKRLDDSIRNLRIIVSSDIWKNKMNELLGDKIVYFSGVESDFMREVENLNSMSNDHIIVWTRLKFKLDKEKFIQE
jgi:hypothetical protein